MHMPIMKASWVRKTARVLRNGVRSRTGLAATEFALILPIMTLTFFGMLEASDALMENRRVANAANALADLVSQETEVTTSDIDNVMEGVTVMLEPTANSTIDMRISSVYVDPGDPNRLLVDWSRDNNGGTPYASGVVYDKIDASLVSPSASLIVVEMYFDYVSSLTHKVIPAPVRFDRIVTRWPRQSAKVILCGSSPLPACST
ncbi:MAG: hypothetical protein GC153_02145 [Alphaproteobacteria bacterium]|nr:hypothetical protein [Alphaproteobacteria bacterium]